MITTLLENTEKSISARKSYGNTCRPTLLCIEAMSSNLKNADIDQIDAALRKARRWGITSVEHTYRGIADVADSKLAHKMVANHKHVLHCMIPEIKINARYEHRNNNKSYKADIVKNNKLRYSFIHRNFSR